MDACAYVSSFRFSRTSGNWELSCWQAKGVKSPGFTKTGTTIAGIIYKVSSIQVLQHMLHWDIKHVFLACGIIWLCTSQDGVVLGADTRSTAGTTVADKNCEKIHYIAPNIYCCGAGTAADTENVTGVPEAWLHCVPRLCAQQRSSYCCWLDVVHISNLL
jgi:Proteasome subunit